MDKAVYLFELDSVRNSMAELRKGHIALFEEIVFKGNTVMLSFNQLTDSKSFLSLLSDEKTYNCIIELFQLGAIKISLFGSYRTPSQYIQTAISKIKDNDSVFIFSGVPVRTDETELIQDIQNALRYTDIGIIKQRVEAAEKSGDNAEYERLVFLERYIRLILLLSGEELANVPPSKTSHKFIEYMDLILKNGKKFSENKKSGKNNPSFDGAIQLLLRIREELEVLPNASLINNRSQWMDRLPQDDDEKTAVANAVIDLCYDYAVESSISGVSKHYHNIDDTFVSVFGERLQSYLADYHNGIHSFSTAVGMENIGTRSQLPWKTAAHIVRNTRKRKKPVRTEIPLYEEDYEVEQKRWSRCIAVGMIREILVTIAYILMFCGIEMITNVVQGFFEGNGSAGGIWYDVLSIIIFGITGSVISRVTGLPDLLDNFRSMGGSFVDIVNLIRCRKYKGTSYVNRTRI